MELIIRLLTHLRVTPDRKTVEVWLNDHTGSSSASISFWPFFIVAVDKCLAPRGVQATNKAVHALYEEIVDEVMLLVWYIVCRYDYNILNWSDKMSGHANFDLTIFKMVLYYLQGYVRIVKVNGHLRD